VGDGHAEMILAQVREESDHYEGVDKVSDHEMHGGDASVSDRLAALKIKLNQSRGTKESAADRSGAEGKGSTSSSSSRGLDRTCEDDVDILEEETVTRHGITASPKDQEMFDQLRVELEHVRTERDTLHKEYMEKIDMMKIEYDGIVRELQRERDERQKEVDGLRKHMMEIQQVQNSGSEDVEQALMKSNMELKFAKDQLHRLKSQMIASQDEQEDQIRWRVEEELRSRLEMPQMRDEQLVHDLEIALDKVQQSEKELEHLKVSFEAKEEELKNMQIALEELSYESEATEKLRMQVRSLEATVRSKDAEVEIAHNRCIECETQAKEALEQLGREKKKAAAAREAEGAARQEMISLQVSYNDLALRMKGADNHKTYDRSLILNMLKDMASMRHSQAIKKAISMLSLTDEECTFVLGDDSSLANNWVTFLESQVNEDSI